MDYSSRSPRRGRVAELRGIRDGEVKEASLARRIQAAAFEALTLQDVEPVRAAIRAHRFIEPMLDERCYRRLRLGDVVDGVDWSALQALSFFVTWSADPAEVARDCYDLADRVKMTPCREYWGEVTITPCEPN